MQQPFYMGITLWLEGKLHIPTEWWLVNGVAGLLDPGGASIVGSHCRSTLPQTAARSQSLTEWVCHRATAVHNYPDATSLHHRRSGTGRSLATNDRRLYFALAAQDQKVRQLPVNVMCRGSRNSLAALGSSFSSATRHPPPESNLHLLGRHRLPSAQIAIHADVRPKPFLLVPVQLCFAFSLDPTPTLFFFQSHKYDSKIHLHSLSRRPLSCHLAAHFGSGFLTLLAHQHFLSIPRTCLRLLGRRRLTTDDLRDDFL